MMILLFAVMVLFQDTTSFDEQLEKATAHLEAGEYEAFEAIVKPMLADIDLRLAENPEDTQALLEAGILHTITGEAELGTEFLDKALAVAPKNHEALFYRSLIDAYEGNLDQAVARMEIAVAVQPDDTDYRVHLAKMYFYAERLDDAKAAFQAVVKTAPEDPDALFGLATIASEQGDQTAALGYYETLLEHNPESVNTLFNIGQIQQNLGNDQKALDAFLRLTAVDPTDWAAQAKIVELGQTLGKLEARDQAREALIALYQKGDDPELAKQNSFLRERIDTDKGAVYGIEFFEVSGQQHFDLYKFLVYEEGDEGLRYMITLCSSDILGKIAAEMGKDEEYWFVEWKDPEGNRRSLVPLSFQPAYETVRQIALNHVNGKEDLMEGVEPVKAVKAGKEEP